MKKQRFVIKSDSKKPVVSGYSFFTPVINILISLIVLTCAISAIVSNSYVLSGLSEIKKLSTGSQGIKGYKGPDGYNDYLNNTILEDIQNTAEFIRQKLEIWFCPASTCLRVNESSIDLNNIIIDNNLENESFISLISKIDLIEEITSNNTFCYIESCEYVSNFTYLYSSLVGNGTNGTAGFVSETEALVELLTNNTFVKLPVNDISFINNGSFYLHELNAINPYSVLVTDSNSNLITLPSMSRSLGGIGVNSSISSGFLLFNGTNTFFIDVINRTFVTLDIVDSDISNDTLITNSKFGSSNINSVVVTNATGHLVTNAYVKKENGGFDGNALSFNGFTLFFNGDLSFGTVLRMDIEAGIPGHVVINDGNGLLSSVAYLPPSLGGFGKNATLWNGFIRSNPGDIYSNDSGIIQYEDLSLTLINNDFASDANISRSKFAAGTPNHVLINTGTFFSSNNILSLQAGGTGIDSSILNGFVIKNVGATFFSTTGFITYAQLILLNSLVNSDFFTFSNIARTKIASGSANHVVINNGSGSMSSTSILPTSAGGLGADLSLSSGILRIISGIGSVLSGFVVDTSYTPILRFAGLNTGITQIVTRGRYTRQGNEVTVNIFIILSSKGTASGAASINLPIAAVADDGSGNNWSNSPIMAGNLDLPAGYTNAVISPSNGLASALFLAYGDNNRFIVLTNTNFADSTSFQCSFKYFVA